MAISLHYFSDVHDNLQDGGGKYVTVIPRYCRVLYASTAAWSFWYQLVIDRFEVLVILLYQQRFGHGTEHGWECI